MSELKVHRFITTDELFPEANAGALYYDKSEADKVIVRNKYKRCLAMAEACMHKRWRTDEGFDYARSHRHMNKWLDIAEKFKEAK